MIFLNLTRGVDFTAMGIGLCTLLMLFMVSLYESVAAGCVEYVRTSKADLWVLQKQPS